MLIRLATAVLVILAAAPAPAATLEKLSFDELSAKSTAIARGRASSSRVVRRGPLLYTLYRFEVVEQWKGPAAESLEIALPGGTLDGVTQRFSGVPRLEEGRDYAVFLWKGPSGLTHLTGLSQGVFEIERLASGKLGVLRRAIGDVMLRPDSTIAAAGPLSMSLAEFVARLRAGSVPLDDSVR